MTWQIAGDRLTLTIGSVSVTKTHFIRDKRKFERAIVAIDKGLGRTGDPWRDLEHIHRLLRM